ncbi:hypothetical protein Cni_G26400 [Canna indica]|uniref:Uncharacterized protein n=1 Tax=Canna indica TaxID=4628 RepID=A0AAQ3KYY1_9LILI|nr:hypothetical protein Cni_G26400 [Canna indica]
MAGRWQTPEAPPMTLHLPRRSSRQKPGLAHNLRDLLDQERSAWPPQTAESSSLAGERVAVSGGGENGWRFQAEILRAECNFLRMEREVALRKLEQNRAQMEVALRSAKESLVSAGRTKIDVSEAAEAALQEGIEELDEKLEKLKLMRSNGRRSRSRGSTRKLLLRKSCRGNFDRQASVLRRQLEKMKEGTRVKDIKEIAVPSIAQLQEENATNDPNHSRRFPDDMEMLRRKMEGLSRGMLERMEECSFLLSANTTSIGTSSSSSSSQKVVALDHLQQQQEKLVEGKMELWSCCSCKEAVARIMQQVRTESEQWSEMQEMLEQVKVEMEELRSSRDQWQRRAVASEVNFHSQHAQKLEWKQKARSAERKAVELQKLVAELQKELQPLKNKLLNAPTSSSSPQQSELPNADSRRSAKKQQTSLLDLHKKEKQALASHLKPHNNFGRRSPLQNISNISPLLRPRN